MESDWRFLLGYLFFTSFLMAIFLLGGPQLISGSTNKPVPTCHPNSVGSSIVCLWTYTKYIFSLSSVNGTAMFVSVIISILSIVFMFILIKLLIELVKAIGSLIPFT